MFLVRLLCRVLSALSLLRDTLILQLAMFGLLSGYAGLQLRGCPADRFPIIFLFFFFNDPATPEIYTLSLHDALPIWEPLHLK